MISVKCLVSKVRCQNIIPLPSLWQGNNNLNKLSENSKEGFNLLAALETYNKADTVNLLKGLLVAQKSYIDNYNVDITTIVSTSSLALSVRPSLELTTYQ